MRGREIRLWCGIHGQWGGPGRCVDQTADLLKQLLASMWRCVLLIAL